MRLATPGGPLPLVAIVNGQKYAVYADRLNTPRQLSDASGQPVWQWAYSAFGEEAQTLGRNRFANPEQAPSAGTTSLPEVEFNLRYPGQYADKESGLFYNYFRSYSPTSGRYTQADPIGLDGGWNRFGYVGGNALGFSDPTGLQAYTGQTPLPDIPGEPWTPQAGQRPGAFQGPANPNGGACDMCQYVLDESNGGPRGARGILEDERARQVLDPLRFEGQSDYTGAGASGQPTARPAWQSVPWSSGLDADLSAHLPSVQRCHASFKWPELMEKEKEPR